MTSTPEAPTPEQLLRGTPYLHGDALHDSAFEAVLRRSTRVEKRASRYREALASQTRSAQELILGSERGKQVAESNKVEGYMWEADEVAETVRRSAELLDAPLRDLMRSVESDPRAFQVLGLYKAYEIADKWAHEQRRPSEVDIRQLHHLITAGDDGAGAYRLNAHPIAIKNQPHMPPDPLEVPRMMREFVDWWHASRIDPLLTATIVHAWLTHIHPFHDGNGRLARLLASICLVQEGYPPLIIASESDRERYYDNLAESDEGNILPLFDLFASMQEREAAMIARADYIDSILKQTIYRDPGNRRRAWLTVFDRFFAELSREFNGVGWRIERFGVPTAEQFALLEDRDSAGNSWAAKITDALGNSWLMWFGFRSAIANETLKQDHTPSLFFSPTDKFNETGKPYRRRGELEGAEDGVPDEIILLAAPKSRCYVRTSRTLLEIDPEEAANGVRKAIVAFQRRLL